MFEQKRLGDNGTSAATSKESFNAPVDPHTWACSYSAGSV